MRNGLKTGVGGLFGAALAMGTMASAASVTPQFNRFDDLTTLDGLEVTFGGSGIPTNPAAITDFTVGDDRVRVGIIATPRFGSPALTNDGAGTYTARAGESAPGLSLWNFSFYAESSGNLADANLSFYYDLDPAAGNDLSTLLGGPIQASGSVFEGSENLGFNFLSGGTFDPFAVGEYSFRFGVDGGEFAAINVNVTAVPLPAGLPLILTALGGLVWLRRRSA
ncbi:VPLPA-CTERM sorting domain-containing protein [Sedimentitalea arenosa]|uniref:VPLPA-CTERM sorting domain-containing protein n=1 Tax=Sedimentitalea arenosa TaxID=2798803 RepID=A0A8J7IWV1_9RHOB|nr:VPLPA-CTERM sorting domain-containing protein [Arenibacterium arenosum]MBJ6373107.1 VPLPA-CTERM sorting domain-containing protein [Arenibacterium arenosum]